MKIIIGHLGLCDEGIKYYGGKGVEVVFPFPIQLGQYVIPDVNDTEDIRLEIVKEGKKHFIVGYDDSRLGMVVKASLHSVYVINIILEIVSRKFKVKTKLSEMRDATKNGIETKYRVWIDSPDAVDEDDLRKFLSKRS